METLRFVMISTHYPPHNLGGDAVFVEYLSNALTRLGHEVHVIYTPSAYEFLRRERQGEITGQTSGGPHIHQLRLRGGTANLLLALIAGRAVGALKDITDVVGKVEPDVVHWHNTKGFVGRPSGIPGAVTLYTAHDYYAVCPRSNLLRPDMSVCQNPSMCQLCNMRWRKPAPLWRMGRHRAMKIPDEVHVISPSHFLARRLERDDVTVKSIIPNFVPDVLGEAGQSQPQGDVITYVGLLEPHKGPQTLLEAFHRCEENQGFSLVIVGEGRLRTALEARAKELGLTHRVRIPGRISREEIINLRMRSTTHVIPSEWPENSPLTALESLAMGVPLIASNLGGLPEIACPESGSTTFQARDADELAQAITDAWERRSNLSAARAMARRFFKERHSTETHIARYLETIRELQRR